jgi:hypothetical protein
VQNSSAPGVGGRYQNCCVTDQAKRLALRSLRTSRTWRSVPRLRLRRRDWRGRVVAGRGRGRRFDRLRWEGGLLFAFLGELLIAGERGGQGASAWVNGWPRRRGRASAPSGPVRGRPGCGLAAVPDRSGGFSHSSPSSARSQHGTAGSGPHLRGSPTLKRAEPPYGRSQPWPVSRVLHPSTWGWTSTRTPSRWGSCRPTSRSHRSSGSPTTTHRSAGSSAASATPACCEPATRPARPASSWPGCCTAWRSAARWSPRR